MSSTRARRTTPDPVVTAGLRLLEGGDLAGARAHFERERWFADARGDVALLLFGCHVAEGKHAAGIDVLRSYLQKTPDARTPAAGIAERLLRHHASGGGLKARGPREAAYFGLYARYALEEPETAAPDLQRARREAPAAERALLAAAGVLP